MKIRLSDRRPNKHFYTGFGRKQTEHLSFQAARNSALSNWSFSRNEWLSAGEWLRLALKLSYMFLDEAFASFDSSLLCCRSYASKHMTVHLVPCWLCNQI